MLMQFNSIFKIPLGVLLDLPWRMGWGVCCLPAILNVNYVFSPQNFSYDKYVYHIIQNHTNAIQQYFQNTFGGSCGSLNGSWRA